LDGALSVKRISLIAALGVSLALVGAARADAPYMGVDTWYAYFGGINEATIVHFVDSAASDGLQRAGYRYVWLDAGWWSGARNADGSIAAAPAQWPHGMAWIASYIHAHGFLAGIYEETGVTACFNGGALGHVQQDIDTFAAWGFDAVKADYCGDETTGLLRPPAKVFGQFAHAIANDQPHRAMILNAADADVWDAYPLTAFDAWTWGPKVATSWRTDTDLSWPGAISWAQLLRNIDADAQHPGVAGHGHWNDPDYLVPGRLPFREAQAQFTMWAMLAAPMMVSADLRTLPPPTVAMLKNRRALAISQDRLGAQGRPVMREGQLEIWRKPLSGGRVAVAILNRGARAARVRVSARTIKLDARRPLNVLNVWGHAAVLLRVQSALQPTPSPR
jgi:alpha-galactosidase